MRWTPRKLQTGHPPKRMKVTFPVNIVQIRVANGTSAVDHHTIADINAAVRNAIHAVAHRAFKEHHVARFCLRHRDIPAQAPQSFCAQSARIVYAGIGEYIADEARTVEAGFG